MKKLFFAALMVGLFSTGCMRDNDSSITDKISSSFHSITNTISSTIQESTSSITDKTSSIISSISEDISSVLDNTTSS